LELLDWGRELGYYGLHLEEEVVEDFGHIFGGYIGGLVIAIVIVVDIGDFDDLLFLFWFSSEYEGAEQDERARGYACYCCYEGSVV